MPVFTIEKPIRCETNMADVESLKAEQVDAFLRQAVQDGLCGTLSLLREGKWSIFDIVVMNVGASAVAIQLFGDRAAPITLKTEQPVGVCLQHERHKYIFESTVLQPPSPDAPFDLTIELPEKIEKMRRRAYDRQSVPSGLTVRVTFWHRGYMDDSDQIPQEDYWQGKLENLSAGGVMIRVGAEDRACFSVGQLLGVQFTPMSYQKPLLLEGHIRHLNSPPDDDCLIVGVEFLGLEASPEGRDVLRRMVAIVDTYTKMNRSTGKDEEK